MRRTLLTDMRPLVEHATELGLDVHFVRRVRGDEEWHALPVPERIRRGDLLWRHALERVGPDLPVRLALLEGLEHLGALALAMRSADTLAEAWRRLLRYHELFLPMPVWRLDDGDPVVLDLVWAPPLAPEILRVSREYLLALFLRFNRDLASADPEEVRLPPDSVAERAFRGHLGVEARPAAAPGLVYAASAWSRPLRQPDPALSAFVLGELDALAARTRTTDDFVRERIADIVRRRLPSGPPSMTEVARELATTERTLRRRLAALGTTYAAIVDEAREALARELVRGSELSLAEVAHLLGFSEPSAFHRAFKRWTGETPTHFRGF